MKNLWLLPTLLMCAMLPLAGCDDGGGDSSDEDAAAAAATAEGAADGDAADTAATEDAAAPATEPAVDFASIQPTGLRVIDRFDIVGRGTQFTVGCDSIPGAVGYVFTTGFGVTATEPVPQTSFFRNGSALFTLDLYAINAAGTATRHALLYVE